MPPALKGDEDGKYEFEHPKGRAMEQLKRLPPSRQDLHAYLDGELSPAQSAQIDRWLGAHPEQRRELLELRLRESRLRSALLLARERPFPETDALKRQVDKKQTLWSYIRSHKFLTAGVVLVVLSLLIRVAADYLL